MEQVAGLVHRRKRQPKALERRAKRCHVVLADGLGDRRDDPVAMVDPALAGREPRIAKPALEAEAAAETLPLLLTDDRNEDRLAVAGLEQVVDGPGRVLHGPGGGGLARHALEHHGLGHEEHVVLEQRALDVGAAAGALALGERRLDRDDAEHAAHDVVHGGAGAHRLAGRAGHVGEAAHHLHDLVERQAVLVGTRQEALERAVDEPGMFRRERLVVEAEAFQQPRPEVLDQHVGGADQAPCRALALGCRGVDDHAALVAAVGGEEARSDALEEAGPVALRRLDLDHVGAKIGEDHPARRSHHHLGEFDDADTRQRKPRHAAAP